MRILLVTFLLFLSFSAFSQGPVDRIELGYQTSKRGIEWTRPGLPTHVPVWRVSRDTNTIIWHDKNTGIRYDWDYLTSVWYARGRFSSALPPLPTQTSGLAAIDNRTAFWLNASNILHRYDITQTAWVPLKITYQSAAPTNVAAGVSNGAAVYTTTLWQDSDDFLIRYWDGDSWELIGGGTDLTFSGASSPVTLNSSTGTDVTITAGTGISLAGSTSNMTITNTAPDQTVTITGGGINVVTGTYPNFTVTGTEVGTVSSVGLALPTSVFDISGSPVTSTGTLTATFDNQTANAVFSGPASGGAATPTFRALVAADITSFATTGTGTLNYVPKWTPNGTTFGLSQIFDDGTSVSIGGGTPVHKLFVNGVTKSGGNIITAGTQGFKQALDGNNTVFGSFGTNESTRNWQVDHVNGGFFLYIQAAAAYSFVVDASGNVGVGTSSPQKTLHVQGTTRITGSDGTATTVMGRDGDGDISALSLSGMSISSGTLTATDGSTTNELQTIANTSNSTSHTATLSNSGGSLQIIEGAGVLLTTGGTGLNGTVSIEAIDPSTTNEIQTYSASGAGPTSYDMTVSSGGTVTLAEGSGIDLTRSTNTITIASTGITSATGYINGGNSFGGAATIGLNDNFDWSFETNGANRMWIDNSGPVSIGATQLTTAALNINGLQGGIGQLIAGGSGLTAPNFYQATGSGSGSTATVFSGVISMLNGNVESVIQNTSTSGSGGVVMELNAKTATGDPRLYMTIDGTTDWSIGIDNDDVDNLKLHRFAAPSDNNGEGTIEFGYDGTMIGMGINKTGIGTATNGYYALDIFGKTRADQFVNNRYDITSTPVATMAVGTAAGTSPTVDNTVTSVWGNAARLKFTSGSSPTANGVVCTITLGTEYTFNECIPIMQGRSTNAGAFNYSCSYDSGTRVITCTLVGTLTASTVYEFNIIFLGRN